MTEQVKRWVMSEQHQLIRELQRLLQQPSVAARNLGMEECALLTAEVMRGAGIQVEVCDTGGHPALIGRVEGASDRAILVYGHYDVQPPDPIELWEYPPFSAALVDGRIYARGSIDDKGNFMCAVHAVKAFTARGEKPPVTVVFLVEGEEEISSPHLEEFIKRRRDQLRADALVGLDDCVQPDGGSGRPKVVTGEKGICYLELVAEGKREFHSMMAPLIVNPAWRLVWALSTLKGPDERVLIDGFYEDVLPPSPEEIEVTAQMQFSDREWLEASGQQQFLAGRSGLEALKALYFDPTCTICGLVGGYTGSGRKTVLPARASVKLDFRLVPRQSPDRVVDLLREHLDRRGFTDIKINRLGSSGWFRSPVNHPAALAMRQAVYECFHVPPAVLVTYPGSGPGHIFDEVLGVPQVYSGFGPLGDRLHSPNEYMTIEFYIKGILTMARLYELFASGS